MKPNAQDTKETVEPSLQLADVEAALGFLPKALPGVIYTSAVAASLPPTPD